MAVTGELGLPWRLQAVQFENGNAFEIEPHETEKLKTNTKKCGKQLK